MSLTQMELRHFWRALALRGGALFALGLAAVVWPEQLLVGALLLVGVIATLSGVYEIAVALGIRRRTVHWRTGFADGIMAMLFGALTVGVPRLPHCAALAVTTGWLLFYSALAWQTASVVSPRRVARTALIAIGAVNVVLAVLASYPEGTVFALLFFGAAYAAFLGAWQFGVALWLRHWLTSHTGVLPRVRHAHAAGEERAPRRHLVSGR